MAGLWGRQPAHGWLWLLIVMLGMGMMKPSAADNQPAKATTGDMMRMLAEEKTLGETAVALLNQYGKTNQTVYVQGIVQYAQAKAKFDGLIEQLKADLIDGRDPGQSPDFQQALQQAGKKRQALFDYVVRQVAPPTENTKGFPILTAVAELIPAVSDAAIKLWHEFRDARSARRNEIKQQLDAQKWLPFDRLVGGNR